MCKAGRIFLMILNVFIMIIIGIIFGFTDIKIPGGVCVLLYFICMAAIDYASGDTVLER